MQKADSLLPQSFVTQTSSLEADSPKGGDSSHIYLGAQYTTQVDGSQC